MKNLKLFENFFENDMKEHNVCSFHLISLNCCGKIHFYSAISNALQKVIDFMYLYKTISQTMSWKNKNIDGNTNL